MKKQQRISSNKPQQKEQPNDLNEIKKRRAEQEAEAAKRASEQATREQSQAEALNEAEVLNTRIEEMLSRNPDDFVIRFLQTEGQ